MTPKPDTIVAVMTGVREYTEGRPVVLICDYSGRLVVCSTNEGGHNGTAVDLEDLVRWLYANEPGLLVLRR